MFGEKSQNLVLDLLPLKSKEWLLSIKRFSFFKGKKHPEKSFLILLIDGREKHGGLADRFKGMVSAFCIAQLANRNFRIDHHSPFPLETFLEPNTYDWRIRDTDKISNNFQEARLIHLKTSELEDNLKRIERLPTKYQLHCYCQGEFFLYLKHEDGSSFDFSEEFNKLFKPNKDLRTYLDQVKKIIGGQYIAVVFRFQNLLGDFPEYDYTKASLERQGRLIQLCIKALTDLKIKHSLPILVTSDSQVFLEKAKNIEKVFSFPSKVVHLDYVNDASLEVYRKSFVDFYLIAKSEYVYSAGTHEMYKSDFPNYAAKVNNIPFERILIEG